MANFRYDNDMLLKKEITGVGICEGGYSQWKFVQIHELIVII